MNTLTKKILWGYVALCALVFITTGLRMEPAVYRSVDFSGVYLDTQCLLHGCDPYLATPAAVYPPSTFLAVLPLAAMPWDVAHMLWLLLIVISYSAAAFCMADICLNVEGPAGEAKTSAWAVILLGFYLAFAMLMIVSGQPASVAIAFTVIALWCLLRGKFILPCLLLFTLGLLIKPQLGGPVWIYLMCTRQYRRRAWQILAMTIVPAAIAVIWLSLRPSSVHWLAGLRANLAYCTLPGGVNDPGPANQQAYNMLDLQMVFASFRNRGSFYNAAAILTTIPLLLFWANGVRRKLPGLQRDLCAMASIAAISMFPLYHRAYDFGIVMLLVPAAASVAAVQGSTAVLLFLLIAVIATLTPMSTRYVLWVNHTGLAQWDSAHILRSLLLARNLPVLAFAMTCLLLVMLYRLPDAAKTE